MVPRAFPLSVWLSADIRKFTIAFAAAMCGAPFTTAQPKAKFELPDTG
jgi:hypothetical protein